MGFYSVISFLIIPPPDKRKYKFFAIEKSNNLCEELVNSYYEIAKESVSILGVEEQEFFLNILKKIEYI